MQKNTLIAYILWLFGGGFGLHHFYLGRDVQAFLWWCSFGGVFGLGWIRDLFRIPTYVEDANEDQAYMKELAAKMRHREKPAFSGARFGGELAIGWLFGTVIRCAIPEELFDAGSLYRGLSWIIPFCAAYGVHTVANIGREQGTLKSALIGSYLALPLYVKDHGYLSYNALFSAIAVNWKGKSWRRTPQKKKHLCKRILILGLCAGLYVSLWGSALYYNAYVTTKDGERIKVRDALQHFFKSPAWARTKDTFWELWGQYKQNGWRHFWKSFIKAVDPEGESNAYNVLGLDEGASEKEVSTRYRKLVREWHPDKHQDPEKKREAEVKFMEIQQAYETLSKLHKRRASKNRRGRSSREEQRTEF